ncbi:MAG TPA: NAD(P)-dependent alcohol dehydrogenase [Kofleriaceae bacterium]|nr:NAD(P)-dependent alcohol dehydrogenase [Kofleriaceae bacterium]
MKVVEYDRYGDPSVLVVRDRPDPVAGRGRVVVRVRAAALNPKDVLTRTGKLRMFAGRRFPKRVGYDWAGEIAELGRDVTGLAVGDPVFGMIQAWTAGACGELVEVLPEELARKPAGLDWEHAAALPLVSLTALQALRDLGELAPGQRVLIHGAAGGVGVHAVQIAKALGAHVTTLTGATAMDLVRSLGADEAIDRATWRAAPPGAPGAAFDVVFDVFGNRTFDEMRPLLTPRGTFISTVPKLHVVLSRIRTAFTRPRARLVVVRSRRADLEWLAALVERGGLRAVIDRVLPLADIAEAQRYLATRRARGKVVLRVA